MFVIFSSRLDLLFYTHPAGEKICFYHTKSGNKCAVGALIPDHLYNKNIEKKVIDGKDTHPVLLDMLKKIGINRNLNLLRALQKVHDNEIDYIDSTYKLNDRYTRIYKTLDVIGSDYHLNKSVLREYDKWKVAA